MSTMELQGEKFILFVEFNTTMALAILTELRHCVGVGVGQSCGCETAQGNQHWGYGLLVWRRVAQQTRRETVTGRGQGSELWQIVLTPRLGLEVYVLLSNTKYWSRLQNSTVNRNRYVVVLTVSRRLFLMYLPWKYKIYFQWCRLSCTWYILSIFSSTLSTTSHSLKCRHLNRNYHGVPLYTSMIFIKFHLHLQHVVCSMPQYFKQELFFKQLTCFYIFISRNKRVPLGSKCDKTHIHNNNEYDASAHFMHVRQLLTLWRRNFL